MVGFHLISCDFMWSHVIFNHIKYEDFHVLIPPNFPLFLIFANLSGSELVVEPIVADRCGEAKACGFVFKA